MASSCTERTCPAGAEYECAYVDGSGVQCATWWCDQHVKLLRGAMYCRRHAGTVMAMSTLKLDDGGEAPWPPVHNRGASLVRWVARDLDEPLRALISEFASERDTITVSGQSDVAIPGDTHWIWSWRIEDVSSGEASKAISLVVKESADDIVLAYVNKDLVHEAKPPWIARRQAGEPEVSPAMDSHERANFIRAMVRDIHQAIGEGVSAS